MRIPFPERISYTAAIIFAATLLVVQILERTQFYFALCCFAYIVVAVAAFNIGGGLYRAAGAYVFFNATLTLIVGLCVKAVLAEPADTHLTAPLLTIQVYVGGAIAMFIAVYIESRFRRPNPVISTLFPLTDLRAAFIGSAIIGLSSRLVYQSGVSAGNGSFLAAFRNADQFLPFALILGVIYSVRASNGARSMSPGVIALFLFMQTTGVLSFSKQALFTPFFCWFIAAGVSRFNLRPLNMATVAFLLYLLVHYGTPLCQYGRQFSTGNMVTNIPFVLDMLKHMDKIVEFNRQQDALDAETAFKMAYFNQPEGLFDRLEMVTPDDALTYETDRDGFYGYEPSKEAFENLIPHFIWPNKPTPYFGNLYAHQIGILSPDDYTTSISFSLSADMYHQGGFLGVLGMETAGLTVLFVTLSSLLGDIRDHTAGIVATLVIAHLAPEGGSTGLALLIQIGVICVVIAFTCRYILPVFASIFEPKKPRPTVSPTQPLLAAG